MKPDLHNENPLPPLSTDHDIERRVADLVGRANSRQLWLMFLDDADVQLPVLIPIEGLPPRPSDEHTDRIVEHVRELMGEIGAESIITVLERYAAATLTVQDAALLRSFAGGCAQHGVPLRAQLLSHRTGVRLLTQDELALPVTRRNEDRA